MADAERRSLLERLRLRRTTTSAWQETPDAVPLDDALAAAALAREALTPFGYKRPASELLEQFGGEAAPDARRRATAALALAGVAADPPLEGAQPFQWIQLRRADAAPMQSAAATPALAAAPTPAPAPRPAATSSPAPAPAATSPAELPPAPRRTSWASRTAAKHAPTGPVTRERRVAAGALGLGALLVVMIAAVLLRSVLGDDGGTADAFPTTTTAAAVAPASTTPRAPSVTRATRTAPALPPTITTPAPRARPRRPSTVRLMIAPTEPSYVCVADGRTNATLFEGMLTSRYSVSRETLILRVGVATARIGVDGRPLTINSAPSAYRLTPRGVQGLPGDRPVCGG